MLYLISGASRAGKSIIAKELSKRTGISYFSLDWITMAFSNGLPEHGVHHLLFPDEIAKGSWSFLKAMFESMLWGGEDYILEGESLLPELVIELVNKHPDEIKVCFVGFTDIDIEQKVKDVKRYSKGEKDWLAEKEDDYIVDHINNMVAHSEMIKKSCDESRLTYFEITSQFEQSIAEVLQFLEGSKGHS